MHQSVYQNKYQFTRISIFQTKKIKHDKVFLFIKNIFSKERFNTQDL